MRNEEEHPLNRREDSRLSGHHIKKRTVTSFIKPISPAKGRGRMGLRKTPRLLFFSEDFRLDASGKKGKKEKEGGEMGLRKYQGLRLNYDILPIGRGKEKKIKDNWKQNIRKPSLSFSR